MAIIHRSLTEEMTVGGLPRTLAYALGSLGATMTISLQMPFLAPIFIAAWIALYRVCKKDPMRISCMRRHLNQPKYFST